MIWMILNMNRESINLIIIIIIMMMQKEKKQKYLRTVVIKDFCLYDHHTIHTMMVRWVSGIKSKIFLFLCIVVIVL